MPRSLPSDAPRAPWTRMWTNLFRDRISTQASIRETLGRVPLFQDLSPKDLRKIEDIVHLRSYRAGEPVFRHGEPGLGMYIIHQGSVLIQGGANDPLAGDVSVVLLEEYDFFGEMTLLEEHPHLVTARANTATRLIGLFRPDFQALIEHHPRLGTRLLLNLGRVIAFRFRESIVRLEREEPPSDPRAGS